MKKLLIFLMALSLFTACKNDKNTTRNDRDTRSNNRDKDDYRNDDKNTDDKQNTNNSNDDNRNSSNNDDRSNDNNSNNNKASSWTSGDVNDFTSSCTNSAVEGGMVRTKAQNYCECMQVKLEREYPNPNDAARIDMNSESMKKMVKDCLY